MKSIYFNRYFPKFRNFARLSILSVSLSFSCSGFAQDANTAAIATDVESILQSLNWALRNSISSDPGYIPERLDDLLEYDTATYKFLTGRTSTTASINYNDKNALPYLLGSLVYGLTGWAPNSSQPLDHSLHGDLTTGNQTLAQLLALLHNISNVVAQSATTVVVSNSVSVTNSGGSVSFDDILAANPWWSTNSSFVSHKQWYSQVKPQDGDAQPSTLTFQQAFSQFLSKLNQSSNVNQPNLSNWSSMWGSTGYSSWGQNGRYGLLGGYTWFDYMADWMRSNAVSFNSHHSDLFNLLRNISNEVNDSSAYIANHLDTAFADSNFYLSNIVQVLSGTSSDILASNPWWATNSAFAHDWLSYQGVYPDSFGRFPTSLSFPQAFSVLLSTLLPDSRGFYPDTPDYWRGEWQRFGLNGQNQVGNTTYRPRLSWFDWVSEAMKSNLVLQVVPNYDTLTATVARAYASTDVEEDVSTNSVLASFDEVLETPDTSDIEESFSDTMDAVDAQLRSVSSQFGGDGDPEIVVIPEFTVGGIHVREYRGSLDTSLTRVAHAVCVFLYTVFFICASVRLIRVEWAFWTTLGHSSEA